MASFAIIKIIMKSLFSKSSTLRYPVEPKKTFEKTRGQIENDIEKCIFCGICQMKCPTGAIHVAKADKTWSIARYDCMQCSRCTELCPKKCLSMNNVPPSAEYEQTWFTISPASKVEEE